MSYLGNRLFSFPPEDVDYYLPQLIVLYVHNSKIAEAIYPYLVSRCRTSVYTSLHIIWLLNAFCPDIFALGSNPVRKPKSHGAKLRNLILSEELRLHSSSRRDKHSAVQSRRNPITGVQSESPGTRNALILSKSTPNSHHRTHYRSYSDATCIPVNGGPPSTLHNATVLSSLCPNHRNVQTLRIPFSNTFHLSPHRRSPIVLLEKSLGDLSSGHAFDNGCTCFVEQSRPTCSLCEPSPVPETVVLVDCHCGAPRIKPQYEFIQCLMSIGKGTGGEKKIAL